MKQSPSFDEKHATADDSDSAATPPPPSIYRNLFTQSPLDTAISLNRRTYSATSFWRSVTFPFLCIFIMVRALCSYPGSKEGRRGVTAAVEKPDGAGALDSAVRPREGGGYPVGPFHATRLP